MESKSTFDVSEDELTAVVTAEDGSKTLDHFLGEGQSCEIGYIVAGKIVEVVGDQVVIDVGYKFEGLVPLGEWEDEPHPQPGEAVEVLIEGMEVDTGEIVLSRKKANRMWPGRWLLPEHLSSSAIHQSQRL